MSRHSEGRFVGTRVSAFGGLLLASGMLGASPPLRDDERVRFYDTVASQASDGHWRYCVDGWTFEPEARPGAALVLATVLGIDREALDAAERRRFDARTRLFLADDERGKSLSLTLHGVAEPLRLPRSDSEGRITHCFELSQSPPSGRWWPFQRADAMPDAARSAVASTPSGRNSDANGDAEGRALVLPAEGVSIVSDIDDTIKDTRVLERREMLLNTFVRPFKPVPGMAAAYQAIDADTFEGGNDNGTRFHYLSGSPHPLQPALAGFLRAEGFPEGSLHLREVEVIEDLFGETGTFAHKRAVLDALLAAAPARRFVLVGDSGERDPEIYGATARAWPDRILAIRIRDVTGESREAARYVEAFRDLPEDLWAVFRDPAALRDDAAWRAATAR